MHTGLLVVGICLGALGAQVPPNLMPLIVIAGLVFLVFSATRDAPGM